MDNPHELHPSAEAFIAGQQRLNIVRLDAYLGQGIGAEGIPMLRLNTRSGSSACCAYGIGLDDLVAACDAFNTRIATGRPPHVLDPAAERRQRGMVADAIADRVRQMAFEAMAPRIPATTDVMTDRDPLKRANRILHRETAAEGDRVRAGEDVGALS